METREADNGDTEHGNDVNLKSDKFIKNESEGGSVKLRRELGLFSAINLILGVIIGSGIFVTPTDALRQAGSVGFCLIVWTISGIVSLLGALCFAELGTVVSKSGAEYAYFLETFGNKHKFWGQVPSFVCAFIYVLVLRPAEVAVIVLTFSQYAMQPFVQNLEPEYASKVIKLAAFCALGIMTYINMTSVKLFLKVQNVFGICKVAMCLLVVFGGIYELAKGNTANLSTGFQGTNADPKNISLAMYYGLWAYDGWNSVTVVTEEIINPGVNIPLSISIAVPLVTTLYVLMNVAYMTVLTIPEMESVPAVAVAFGDKVLGPASFLVPLGVAIATFGSAMSVQFGVTRVCYVAAREGHMLEAFSFVNLKRMTPMPAVAFQGMLTAVFLMSGNVKELIQFASFYLWFFYGLAVVALLVLRRTQPDKHRPYRVPTVVAWFVLAMAVFLSVMPIVAEPSLKYLFAILFLFVGVALYTLLVYHRKIPKSLMKHFTFLIQVMFECVPPSHQD